MGVVIDEVDQRTHSNLIGQVVNPETPRWNIHECPLPQRHDLQLTIARALNLIQLVKVLSDELIKPASDLLVLIYQVLDSLIEFIVTSLQLLD